MFIGLKVAGGLYLLWLGYKFTRRGAADGFASRRHGGGTFTIENLPRWPSHTQLSNPGKRRWYSASYLYRRLLPERIPLAFCSGIVPLMRLPDRRQLVFRWWRWCFFRPPAQRLSVHEA